MVTSTFSQERSRVRRDALVRAAVALLAEGGVRGITHRAVATRAGLPLAATTYYFDSIQHLTEEALRVHVEERITNLQELAASAANSSRSVDEVAERFVSALLARDRAATVAQFEVYLEAARNPAFQKTVAEALDAFEELAHATLAALGASHPSQAASAFVALVNGFALNSLARPRPIETEFAALLDAMRALFVRYVMDDDELARWHDRLRQPLDQLQAP
jgi:TetR/AcrR family transcriptional regulator, regulator of biofilm formation and stress response